MRDTDTNGADMLRAEDVTPAKIRWPNDNAAESPCSASENLHKHHEEEIEQAGDSGAFGLQSEMSRRC